MKAIQVKQFGGPEVLEYTSLDTPSPDSDQVLIRVKCIGVNFADVKARLGAYHGKYRLPFVPGLDALGTVEKTGSAVQHLKAGQRVVAFPAGGSYCEQAVAPAALAFAIPDTISDEAAAAFPVVAGTTFTMLSHIAKLKAGESVLVHSAAGGVGTTAVQLARYFKASLVIATVGNDQKKPLLEQLGADAVLNYRSEDTADEIRSLTDGKGVDVILNPLAGDVLINDLKCLALFGRLVCFGHASGRRADISSKLLHNTCRSVLGFSFGTLRRRRPDAVASIMSDLIPLIAEKRIRPVICKQYRLPEAAQAHRDLESRLHTGKILLNVQ